jgi:hypothetical protein
VLKKAYGDLVDTGDSLRNEGLFTAKMQWDFDRIFTALDFLIDEYRRRCEKES